MTTLNTFGDKGGTAVDSVLLDQNFQTLLQQIAQVYQTVTGWSPLLASVANGPHQVLQVTGWTGGTGASVPPTGYIGPNGLVTDINQAVDILAGSNTILQNYVSQAAGSATAAANSASYAQLFVGLYKQYSTYAAANADISNVPANSVISVFIDETQNNNRTWYKKISGAYVLQFIDVNLPAVILNFTALRAYSGTTQMFYVYSRSASSFSNSPDKGGGIFYIDGGDTTSSDDDGVVIVITSGPNTGKRAKRLYSGPVYAGWWGAVEDGTTDDTTSINNALNSGYKSVYLLGTSRITATLNLPVGVSLRGYGASGADLFLSGNAPSTILADFAGSALSLSSASQSFLGAVVSDLMIRSVSGNGAGVFLKNRNLVEFRNVTASDYSNGIGFSIGDPALPSTFQGQYSTFINCSSYNCLTAMKITQYNGVGLFGGVFDGNQNGSGGSGTQPTPGSTGILATSGDNLRVIGTRFQGFATNIDASGAEAMFSGTRHEMFASGIILRGDRQTITDDNNFNNFIRGQSGGQYQGTPVTIAATASNAIIDAFQYESVFPIPVTDLGTNTQRNDSVFLNVPLPLISNNNQGLIIGFVPKGPSRIAANANILNNGASFGSDTSNYWGLAITGGPAVHYTYEAGATQGWPPNQSNYLFGNASASAGSAEAPGAPIFASFLKGGAPANISAGSFLSIELQRY